MIKENKHLPPDSFKKCRLQKELDVWVPHKMAPDWKQSDRISIWEYTQERNKIELFLRRLFTGDENNNMGIENKCTLQPVVEVRPTAKDGDAEIRKESYTMSCCRMLKRLVRISTANN